MVLKLSIQVRTYYKVHCFKYVFNGFKYVFNGLKYALNGLKYVLKTKSRWTSVRIQGVLEDYQISFYNINSIDRLN